jgi:phenylacetate-CoA ligase
MERSRNPDSLDRVRSSVGGMVWPALPAGGGANLLALQFQFDQTQWWPAAALERNQLRQLDFSLRHAHESVPFHRERLAAAGYPFRESLTSETFRLLPRSTRSDVQVHGEAMLSRAVPAEHGQVNSGETSGSTGAPIRHYGTDLTQFFWHACTLRDHLWHRREMSSKTAAIRKGVQDAEHPSWGPPADLVFGTGPRVTLGIATDLDAQLDWLQRHRPAYLITNAYNLYWLARRSIERGITLPELRQVRSFGGTFPEDAREVARRAWNASLADIYTAEEVGYIALQCPEHNHYHVQSENLIVEILDEAGRPCAPGAIGKVVLTTLHNFAMPLVRYEIGDYAEAGAPCPCGRGLPVIRRILGRERNILTLPDGRQRWPSFPSDQWSQEAPVRQLQMVQHTRESIEVRVVPERTLTAREKEGLIAALRRCLGHPFEMKLTELAEIPRNASYKFEDFISKIV